MNFQKNSIRSLLLVLLAGLSFGCNSDGRFAVSGKVTLDGTPVPEGTISFMPTGPTGSSDAAPIKNGEYSARISPGTMIVKIYSDRSLTPEEITAYRNNPMTKSSITPPEQVKKQIIPVIYNDQSTLRVDIKENRKNLDFDLNSDEKK